MSKLLLYGKYNHINSLINPDELTSSYRQV